MFSQFLSFCSLFLHSLTELGPDVRMGLPGADEDDETSLPVFVEGGAVQAAP